MASVLLSVYALTLTGLIFFAAHRLKILWLYARCCRRGTPAAPAWEGPLPLVCVQCPVYNEPLVVSGLLDCVTALRWPEDRIEIQILDDSTDHTPDVIEECTLFSLHPARNWETDLRSQRAIQLSADFSRRISAAGCDGRNDAVVRVHRLRVAAVHLRHCRAVHRSAAANASTS